MQKSSFCVFAETRNNDYVFCMAFAITIDLFNVNFNTKIFFIVDDLIQYCLVFVTYTVIILYCDWPYKIIESLSVTYAELYF